MKVVEYSIISREDLEELVLAVNLDLKKGWYLYGAPFSDGEIRDGHEECCIHQAMVKYET